MISSMMESIMSSFSPQQQGRGGVPGSIPGGTFQASFSNPFSMTNTRRENIAVDVLEDENNIYIYAEIPGVSRDNITIDVINNQLTIIVNRERSYNTQPQIAERLYGRLERKILLPICVTRPDTIHKTYIDGILAITIRKFIEEQNRFTVTFNDPVTSNDAVSSVCSEETEETEREEQKGD